MEQQLGKFNKAQELQFIRLELGTFNSFNGQLVGSDLRLNPDLWESFMFGRFGVYGQLIELRDLSTGHVNADTLCILAKKDKLPELQKLIATWRADEVNFITSVDEGASFGEKLVLSEETNRRLGASLGDNQILVEIWWD